MNDAEMVARATRLIDTEKDSERITYDTWRALNHCINDFMRARNVDVHKVSKYYVRLFVRTLPSLSFRKRHFGGEKR